MSVTVRQMQEGDVPRVGAIMVAAFNAVFHQHGYPAPFSSLGVGTSLALGYLRLEPATCFTAIRDGVIVGSGFLHPRGDTAGVGPITVDPDAQDRGTGQKIMDTVLEAGQRCPSLRLVQDAFNVVSFPLYSKLGFEVRGVVAALVGQKIRETPPADIEIQDWQTADIEPLSELDTRLTGISRVEDFRFFHTQPPHLVARLNGQPAGYLCFLRTGAGTFLGPAAATDQAVLRALILSAVQREAGRALRMRFPARHVGLLQELLALGFRVENLQTYMVRGPWTQPAGVDLLALFPEAL